MVAVRVVDGSITHDHESITLVMRSDIATSIDVQPLNHNPHYRPSHLSYPPSTPSSPYQPPFPISFPPRSSLGLDSSSTTIPSALHPHCRRGRHLHHRATQQHPASAYYTATPNSPSQSPSLGYCCCWWWYIHPTHAYRKFIYATRTPQLRALIHQISKVFLLETVKNWASGREIQHTG